MVSSELQGFYKLSVKERRDELAKKGLLSPLEAENLSKGGLELETANRMVENVIGLYALPFGVATNFLVNGKDYLVPMVIEEPSVIAAASNAAKMARPAGGFTASTTEPVMIGQVQLVNVPDAEDAVKKIIADKQRLLDSLMAKDPVLVKFGGGPRNIEARVIDSPRGRMVVVHLSVDVRDAMGANAVNTMCEALAPELEHLSGGKALLRILSNLAVYRKARAKAVWKKEVLGGESVVKAIVNAWAFAAGDPFRCATHNKGIMNGIDAVVVATGNDWRAVEAGAHAFACYERGYSPLTTYRENSDGDLEGEIELPMAVGTVGGATRTHPLAQFSLKLAGIKNAQELSCLIAAVGLAQNFAAIRALSTEGIQRGHMELHARNIAAMAGATGADVDRVAEQMIKEKNIRVDRAKEILGKKE